MEWLSAVSTVFGLVGFFGGASAYLFSSRSKSIIELQDTEIKALKESNARLSDDMKNLEARARSAEDKAKLLQDLVTQAPNFKELFDLLKNQNAAQGEHNKIITQSLAEVAKELAALTKAIHDEKRTK